VHVNPGGEPERDDTGLPPVDIEIPDDARELDRDVQAYYRELRARRRHLRSRRFHGMLARDGMVLPLLVCCLIFALVTGTLLTLFTATSIDQGLPGASTAGGSPKTGSSPGPVSPRAGTSPAHRSAGASPGASAAASPAVTPLPADLASALVSVPGKPARMVGQLGVAVLLLVPAGCSSCRQAAGQLAALARVQKAPTYLIATRSHLSEAKATASQISHGLPTATDVTGLLDSPGLERGLTAILVSANGSVVYQQRLQQNTNLAAVLKHGGL
jgi:hypothetical protein